MEIVPLILVVLDEDDREPKTRMGARHYALAMILAFGVIAPVAYQLAHNTKLIASAISALILFAIPLSIAAYCVYRIMLSSKRGSELLLKP
jgi:quinol-cytochrome oxidoreductase complex cytochrome b subunit